jgi:hypothetical protein
MAGGFGLGYGSEDEKCEARRVIMKAMSKTQKKLADEAVTKTG